MAIDEAGTAGPNAALCRPARASTPPAVPSCGMIRIIERALAEPPADRSEPPGDNSAAILAAILAAFPDATIEIVSGPLDDDLAVEVGRPLSHLDASQAVRKRRGDFSPVGSAAEP
ncbi:hypothetical protein FV232_03250 [Methylobacterium sp. WL30]|uniref:hypothetical protein n=1 Tax=unclassified Methylobacterium TaxID=2615210 RepID=UPI0011C8E711|nr:MULTISPECIES: hypothetical protein [unclassified Methylobacterium]TXM92327.1 hypothetical protein FV223_12200 [Methylobacterium sp. WL116]TXN40289.1 hypothetical protein FV225_06755 [Methylobacterium sp. WL93]TXN51349.1 hypothetical protein FV227_07945 [Methylobacterium sp. WL119]TXN70105.1 hypothetical protein FV232_03250 [Methylobacterium sp. WL30]